MRTGADEVGLCVSTLHVEPHGFVPADVERMTRVAAAAGFPSLAFQVHWVVGYGVEATRALLAELGITAGALEGAVTWAAGPDAARADADQLLDVAAAVGAPLLHAACLDQELDSSRAADGFAALCERAVAYGIDVSIEFIPWYAIPDVDTAWEIVRASGASNGGICVDLMHWQRQPGGPSLDALRAVPADRISYVQLTDAPAAGVSSPEAYMLECLTERPLPGDGVVDVAEVLEALDAMGTAPYYAYQVCNPAMAAQGAETMAAQLRENAAKLFAAR